MDGVVGDGFDMPSVVARGEGDIWDVERVGCEGRCVVCGTVLLDDEAVLAGVSFGSVIGAAYVTGGLDALHDLIRVRHKLNRRINMSFVSHVDTRVTGFNKAI